MNAPFPHRIVQECISCSPLNSWPDRIPKRKRGRGAKGAGITYEKKVGRILKRILPVEVVSERWWLYNDLDGRHLCQTDHYAVYEDQVLVVECKLTESWIGHSQINNLYRPVLERFFQRPITGIVACKVRTSRDNRVLIEDPREALEAPGKTFVWHCLA